MKARSIDVAMLQEAVGWSSGYLGGYQFIAHDDENGNVTGLLFVISARFSEFLGDSWRRDNSFGLCLGPVAFLNVHLPYLGRAGVTFRAVLDGAKDTLRQMQSLNSSSINSDLNSFKIKQLFWGGDCNESLSGGVGCISGDRVFFGRFQGGRFPGDDDSNYSGTAGEASGTQQNNSPPGVESGPGLGGGGRYPPSATPCPGDSRNRNGPAAVGICKI